MAQELVAQLRSIAEEMHVLAGRKADPEISEPLGRLEAAADEVAEAWSGSQLGYHACVYYENLESPPPGAHFSPEWGLQGVFQGSTGGWREYRYAEVLEHISQRAGSPDLQKIREIAASTRAAFTDAQSAIVSILSALIGARSDDFLLKLKIEAEQVMSLTKRDAIQVQMPSGGTFIRDSLAATQGMRLAPHQEIRADVVSLRSPFSACMALGNVASRAAAHIERVKMVKNSTNRQPDEIIIFIGHGRSPQWRELKDFIQDRLHLKWDEFERVPVAGVATAERLAEMLDSSGFAFLVLTAEDERSDGTVVARQNVVHEAGLFQGRLGFRRAIVLLEEGCDEFSNIHGLGQIRFPASQISGIFEKVRQVLEREGMLARSGESPHSL